MPDAMPGERNPYLRADILPELLLWHDLDFVRCAFVTMLGRQPDASGESYYVQRLRSGVAKTQLLWQLRRSPEGRAHDPGIAGLDRTLKRASWGRLPLVGWAARLVFKTEPNDRFTRLQRAVLNELGALRRQVADLPGSRAPGARESNTAVTEAQSRERSLKVGQTLSPSARFCFNVMTSAGNRANLD